MACVFLTSQDIIIAIRQLYSASEIVTRLLGQLKIDACLVSRGWRSALRGNVRRFVYRRYLHRRYSFRPATVSARRIVGFQGLFVSDFINKGS